MDDEATSVSPRRKVTALDFFTREMAATQAMNLPLLP